MVNKILMVLLCVVSSCFSGEHAPTPSSAPAAGASAGGSDGDQKAVHGVAAEPLRVRTMEEMLKLYEQAPAGAPIRRWQFPKLFLQHCEAVQSALPQLPRDLVRIVGGYMQPEEPLFLAVDDPALQRSGRSFCVEGLFCTHDGELRSCVLNVERTWGSDGALEQSPAALSGDDRLPDDDRRELQSAFFGGHCRVVQLPRFGGHGVTAFQRVSRISTYHLAHVLERLLRFKSSLVNGPDDRQKYLSYWSAVRKSCCWKSAQISCAQLANVFEQLYDRWPIRLEELEDADELPLEGLLYLIGKLYAVDDEHTIVWRDPRW